MRNTRAANLGQTPSPIPEVRANVLTYIWLAPVSMLMNLLYLIENFQGFFNNRLSVRIARCMTLCFLNYLSMFIFRVYCALMPTKYKWSESVEIDYIRE